VTEVSDDIMNFFKNFTVIPSYLFLQCALLSIHYGLDRALPFWVLWFPTIFYALLLALMFTVLIIAIIVALVAEK
jgi:hypothetical protein